MGSTVDNIKRATELADAGYTLVIVRNPTTTGEGFVYLAMNPEIPFCKAQGLTMEEAQENLRELRIDIFEHYLDNQLPVPKPEWKDNSGKVDNGEAVVERTSHENKDEAKEIQYA